MYYVGEMNRTRAFDAHTGKLWEYDPQVSKEILDNNMKKVFWKHSRGLSTYGDKLFIATGWPSYCDQQKRRQGSLANPNL